MFLNFGPSKMCNFGLDGAPCKCIYFLVLPQGLLLYKDGTWAGTPMKPLHEPTLSTQSDTQWKTNPQSLQEVTAWITPGQTVHGDKKAKLFFFFFLQDSAVSTNYPNMMIVHLCFADMSTISKEVNELLYAAWCSFLLCFSFKNTFLIKIWTLESQTDAH